MAVAALARLPAGPILYLYRDLDLAELRNADFEIGIKIKNNEVAPVVRRGTNTPATAN